MIKSEAGIYPLLEEIIRASGETPLTCVDLYEDRRVKDYAESPNRVSDYLGHMWRRGLLQRWYAPKDKASRSRYAYTWIAQEDERPVPIDRLTVVKNSSDKPNVMVTEADGSITLDFKEFTITILRK